MTTAFDKSVMFAGKRPEPVTALNGNENSTAPWPALPSDSPPEIGEFCDPYAVSAVRSRSVGKIRNQFLALGLGAEHQGPVTAKLCETVMPDNGRQFFTESANCSCSVRSKARPCRKTAESGECRFTNSTGSLGGPPTARLLSRAMGAERIGITIAWITVIHQVGGAGRPSRRRAAERFRYLFRSVHDGRADVHRGGADGAVHQRRARSARERGGAAGRVATVELRSRR